MPIGSEFDEIDFGNDDKAANLAVSDHRPVWVVFRINEKYRE